MLYVIHVISYSKFTWRTLHNVLNSMSVDVDELALYLYTVSNKTKRRPELYYSPSLTQQGWGGLLWTPSPKHFWGCPTEVQDVQ